MRAIEIKDEKLVETDRLAPSPAEGEVLIKVAAAGVNRPDLLQRKGLYPPPEGITDIPGLEVAGEIVESNSDQWKEGDKVCALLAGGGYAEYAVVPAGQCLPVPAALSMEEAAALPETVFTVWNNLFKRGNLQKGETCLVHGGTSGIGTTAIQMAKAWGTNIIITAGTNEKCTTCVELGADHAINYKTQDFVEEVQNFTNGDGVNIVLDMVGGDYVPRNLECLTLDGRHVSIAFLNGIKSEINLKEIMHKRLTLTGSTLRARSIVEKTELATEIRQHIWPLIENGKIKPVIHKMFPLSDAQSAHEELESGNHIGKIVLKV